MAILYDKRFSSHCFGRLNAAGYLMNAPRKSENKIVGNKRDCGTMSVSLMALQETKPNVGGKKKRKSKIRLCSVEECDKVIVSKGLCRRHGGGRRCTIQDCGKGSQSDSLFCWAHGGGKRCIRDGCTSRAKKNKLCTAHTKMLAKYSANQKASISFMLN